MDKYISFDPWWGGLNNIRMSYEIAGAISVWTNRRLILPEKIYCLFLSKHQDKQSFFDFWDLFDKDSFMSEFECIDYKDIRQYRRFNTVNQYFDGICNEVKCLPQERTFKNWGVEEDLVNYKFNLKDLDLPDKFIHFPRNLFGHWYSILNFKNKHYNDTIKDKLKYGLKLKDKYKTNFFNQPFNAIHVRSGDFNQTRPEKTKELFDHMYKLVKQRVKPNKPLFIATDEEDRTKFKVLKEYKYYFLDDFVEVDQVSALAMDTLTCSEAEEFYGSRYSTFTDYINILRHYKGKKDCSKQLLNYTFTGNENPSWENCFINEY